MTKFRLISFLPSLREAIERGEKIQTRRLMEGWSLPGLAAGEGAAVEVEPGEVLRAKYGPVGSVLVVRQPWAVGCDLDDKKIGEISPDWGRFYEGSSEPIPRVLYYSNFGEGCVGKRRSDRFMPYWAGRLFLVLESVKYEPVSWINEADALAEGVKRIGEGLPARWDGPNRFTVSDGGMSLSHSEAKGAFGMLWDSLHTEQGTRFADSPMVWAYTFRAVAVGSEEWQGYKKELLAYAVEKWQKAIARASA
jgi:hypothetical protein